jgi:AcrR family transcriptional regulator
MIDPSHSSHSSHARVLQAAAAVFLEQGYVAASMEQVRQAAGVSNGSLYHHFPTKTHLVNAVYAQTLREFHAALGRALDTAPDAESGVKGLIHAYIAWVVANPDSARLLERLRHRDTVESDEIGQTNAQAFDRLGQWVQEHVASGHMQELPFGVWMALVFSPVRTLTPKWTADARPGVGAALRETLAQAAWLAVSSAHAVQPADKRRGRCAMSP